ncbi:MAG: type II toxin-antitoxin system VapC family toxin [Nostoc sp. NMS1]|uniref:type II toxin-antitoxin system VapC family toxin n=1 Tax=unclassified Nostoc TaxID=2593658 RepID=UPI002600C3EE|nr:MULTISPECIES: PIN domain-containing protein [unclassified Nostoc]MBN3910397.1 type II toxin-antitoxin system VapC family toxin [Nostoc sp. NMS1]MBN3989934.1 type II toxin-antitoxin system VapC family toxin [Nostoc sp. NMS2]
MSDERLFLDTVFIQALLSKRDQYHRQAKAFLPRVRAATDVWVTEAILVEVGNALGAVNRPGTVQFIQQCYKTANLQVVTVDTSLLARALQLYSERPDKTWGLTDCISFTVMWEKSLTDAVTADLHFVQAGFRALLRE